MKEITFWVTLTPHLGAISQFRNCFAKQSQVDELWIRCTLGVDSLRIKLLGVTVRSDSSFGSCDVMFVRCTGDELVYNQPNPNSPAFTAVGSVEKGESVLGC